MEEEAQQEKPNTGRRHNRETAYYSTPYTFDGYLRGGYSELTSMIEESIVKMQRDGISIEFLGAIQRIDTASQLIEPPAWYAASSKGAVGKLNRRACLPTRGPPQRNNTAVKDW